MEGNAIHNSKNDIKTFGRWKINDEIQEIDFHGTSRTRTGWSNPYGQCQGHLDQQYT